VLSTNRKGAIAETAIVAAATRLGIDVYRPVADGGRYDLIFDTGRLVRVQCKWASRMADVVVVRCYSARRTRDGPVRRTYTADEIDAFGAYCAELETLLLRAVRAHARSEHDPATPGAAAEQSTSRDPVGSRLLVRG
jgi:PD-(D/E)XK endonuclease